MANIDVIKREFDDNQKQEDSDKKQQEYYKTHKEKINKKQNREFIEFLKVAGLILVIILSRIGVQMGIIKKDKIIVFLTIIVLLITPFFLPNTIKDWAKNTKSIGELLLNKERLVLYETSFNMIKQHPVIGVGVNTYVLNYQKYKLHDTTPGTANTAWYAHNSYLQMAAEIGITGLLMFLYLLFKLFNGWRKFYIKADDNFLKITSLGILMGIFAFLIHGLTETNLYYPKIAILFWFQVGLLGWIIFSKDDNRSCGQAAG